MAALSLVFDLIGRDVSASKAFKDVGDSADKAGKAGERVGSLIGGGLKLAAGALIGGGLIEGFKSLYDAAAESAKIGRITTQVIQSTGGAAKVSADQVGDLVTAISNKTGVDDEAIQSGANLLLTFTNIKNEAGAGNDIFTQTTQIMTDMSVALGTDASGSAIQLGKALNDPIKGVTALQKVGVSFTEAQKDQIKVLVQSGDVMGAQKVILGELSKEFGGAAEAASTPFDKLQVTLGNLAEQVGGYLIPIVDRFATFLLNNVLPAVSDVAGWVGDHLAGAFQAVGDALGMILDAGQGVVGFFASLPGPVQAVTEAFALLAAANLAGAFSGIAGLAETIAIKFLYMRDTALLANGAMGALRATGSGLMGIFGGPWGLAITGVTIGLGFLVQWLSNSSDATDKAAGATQTYATALEQSKGAIDGNVRAAAAKAAQDAGLLDVANRLHVPLSTVTDAITTQGSALEGTRAQLQAYIDAHTTMVAHGNGGYATVTPELDDEGRAAKGALDALNNLAGTTTVTAAKQQQLAAATAQTSQAAGGAVDPTKQLNTQLEGTSKAASDAKKQTDLFKMSLDILTGANVSMIQVESAFQDAVANATTAITKEGGAVLDASGQLNLHTANGRKTADSLINLRDAGNQLISQMITQGATSEDVQKKDADLRKSFYDTAFQMTHSKDAANRLTDSIFGIPAERRTQIDADTGKASAAIAGVQNQVDGLHGKNIEITVTAKGGQLGNIFTAIPRAMGGAISGPGTGTSDSILVAASNGEHMWTAKEVAAAGGHGAVESLRKAVLANGGGRAAGGPIGVNVDVNASQVDGVVKSVQSAMSAAFTGGSSAGGNPAMRALGQQIAANMGWASQFAAIDYIFSHESGWNPNAQNPTSTAYGIPQFLNSTWAAYGGKTSSPGLQITDGIEYMVNRYGSPNGAAAFWNAHHWYDGGGWLQPGVTIAHNDTGKPERIRTAEQEAALGGPTHVTLQLDRDAVTDLLEGRVVTALTGVHDRMTY